MNFINQILDIDSLVYDEALQGTFESVSKRYYKNKDSYIFVKHNDIIVGYFCFFPISNKLFYNIYNNKMFYDDNVTPEEILPYGKINNLFLISAAIHPQFQNGYVINTLNDKFKQFIQNKENNGNMINSLSAYVTSIDGSKLATRFGMKKIYNINNLYSFYSADRDTILKYSRRD